MKEEDIIRKHDSGRRPFKVPEGYFADFNSRLMERLQAEELHVATPAARIAALPSRRRVMNYAAAAVLAGVCVLTAALLYSGRETSIAARMAELEFSMTDEEVDVVLDSEMMNNNEIAYYLTEAY